MKAIIRYIARSFEVFHRKEPRHQQEREITKSITKSITVFVAYWIGIDRENFGVCINGN